MHSAVSQATCTSALTLCQQGPEAESGGAHASPGAREAGSQPSQGTAGPGQQQQQPEQVTFCAPASASDPSSAAWLAGSQPAPQPAQSPWEAMMVPLSLARRSKSLDAPAPGSDDPLRGQSSDSEADGGTMSDTPFSASSKPWGARSAPLAIPRPASLENHIEAFNRLPSLRDWAGSGGSTSRFALRQPSLGDWMAGSSPAFISRVSSGLRANPLSTIRDQPEEADPPAAGQGLRVRLPSMPKSPWPPRSPKRSRSPSPARLSSRGASGGSAASSLSEAHAQHQIKAPRLDALADTVLAQHSPPAGSAEELAQGFRDFKEVMDSMYSGPQLAQHV